MGADSRVRLAAIVCGLALVICGGTAQANNIPVTTTEDEFNNVPSSTGCALREAIEAAQTNAIHGGCPAGGISDVVQLAGGATYELEIDGTAENLNQTGDLDVRGALEIRTLSGAPATIDAAGIDRAIQIFDDANLYNLKLSRLKIVNGLSDGEGGAVLAADNHLTTDGVVFEHNSAVDDGGAIRSSGRTDIADSVFIDNDSDTGGGGAISQDEDPFSQFDALVLERSAFAGNTADGVGGAIKLFGNAGDSLLVNSTFTDNEGSNGGAIHYQEDFDSPPTLIALTVAGNRATANSGAGGITIQAFNDFGLMRGSIIAGNTNPAGPSNCDMFGSSPYSGGASAYNIDSGTDCQLSAAPNFENTDPQLSPVTQGSPADPDDPPTTVIPPFAGGPAAEAIPLQACGLVQPPDDQRGVSRAGGPCTIGAFEGSVARPPVVTPPPITPSPAVTPAKKCKKKKKKAKKAASAKKKRCKKKRR